MAIQKFELDAATDLDKQKLPIKTVNGKEPDSSGNIETGGAMNAEILAAADKAINERVVNTGQVDLANIMVAMANAEANFDNKSEAFLQKVDEKLSSIHAVVETWSDGTSWYRKYSDGWVEQGGKTTSETVTLHVPMKDTNYTILIAQSGASNTWSSNAYSPTTTGFSMGNLYQGPRWAVMGYAE